MSPFFMDNPYDLAGSIYAIHTNPRGLNGIADKLVTRIQKYLFFEISLSMHEKCSPLTFQSFFEWAFAEYCDAESLDQW